MASILLIEDDSDQREIRRLILERDGHAVDAAASAGAARLGLNAAAHDCVLMDLRLPTAAEGLSLIRDIRRADRAVPIIVLSGWPEDLSGAPEAVQVTLTLTKPVRTDLLLRAVRRVAAGARRAEAG